MVLEAAVIGECGVKTQQKNTMKKKQLLKGRVPEHFENLFFGTCLPKLTFFGALFHVVSAMFVWGKYKSFAVCRRETTALEQHINALSCFIH